jgi:hypothetical protein
VLQLCTSSVLCKGIPAQGMSEDLRDDLSDAD